MELSTSGDIANDQEWKTKYLMSIRKSHSSQPPAATSLNSRQRSIKWSLDSEDDDTNPYLERNTVTKTT
jgi:hypothetical protein